MAYTRKEILPLWCDGDGESGESDIPMTTSLFLWGNHYTVWEWGRIRKEMKWDAGGRKDVSTFSNQPNDMQTSSSDSIQKALLEQTIPSHSKSTRTNVSVRGIDSETDSTLSQLQLILSSFF